jgi:hypothetical protein
VTLIFAWRISSYTTFTSSLFAALESGSSFDHRANVPAKEDLVGVGCFAMVVGTATDPVLVRAIGRVLAPQAQYFENGLRKR